MPRMEPKIVADAIVSKRIKIAIKLASCLIKYLFAASFTRLCRSDESGGKAWKRLSRKPHTRLIGKNLEGTGDSPRRASYGTHRILWRKDLDKEAGRRSARSGTAKDAGSYS